MVKGVDKVFLQDGLEQILRRAQAETFLLLFNDGTDDHRHIPGGGI